MPSWCVMGIFSKGLISLFVALIILQYLFNVVSNIYPRTSATYEEAERFVFIQHNNLTSSISNNTISTSTNELNSTQNLKTLIRLLAEVSTTETGPIPSCPPIPPDLSGPVDIVKSPVPTIDDLESRFSWLKQGGHWFPDECQSLSKVAIVIPYRARGEHLLLFLQHMHPFLKKQQLDYTIFVVEQFGEGNFNRAMLMNVGFAEAIKMYTFDCFIFHDIDLLPEDDRNLYNCPEQPRHMSVAIDVFHYQLPYTSLFGGVSALTKTQFETVNGFSNSFWGWGGEDDDMSNRVRYHNFFISRYPQNIARYIMLTHKKERANPKRYEILTAGKNKFNNDGLNSLKYTVKQKKLNKLYTWVLTELHPPS